MEQKDLRIEEMKREKSEKFRQRKNMHNVEIKLKMAKMDEKEKEVRYFICIVVTVLRFPVW